MKEDVYSSNASSHFVSLYIFNIDEIINILPDTRGCVVQPLKTIIHCPKAAMSNFNAQSSLLCV